MLEKLMGLLVFCYIFSLFIVNDLENFTPVIFALLTIILFIFILIKDKNKKIIIPLPWILLFSFFMLGTFSLLWSIEFHPHVYFNLLHIVLMSLVLINYLVWTRNYDCIINGVLMSLWTSSIIFFIENDLSIDSYRPIPSTFSNPNEYAFALILGLMLLTQIILNINLEKRKILFRNKWIVLLTCLVFSYQILFITGSRKGIIAWFILMLIVFAARMYGKHMLNKYMWIVIIFVVVMVFVPTFKSSDYYYRLENLLEYFRGKPIDDGSINVREQMISKGLNLWSEKPLLGWGLGQYRTVSGFGTYSHNNYIEILSNNGILGFIIFYAIILILLFRAIKIINCRTHKKEINVKFALWFSGIIIVFLFSDLGVVTYYNTQIWAVLSYLISIMHTVRKRLFSYLIAREKA